MVVVGADDEDRQARVAAWDLPAAQRAQQRDRLHGTAEVAEHERVGQLRELQRRGAAGERQACLVGVHLELPRVLVRFQ